MVTAIRCRSCHFGIRSDAHVGCNTLLYFFLTSSFLGLTLSPNRLSEEKFLPTWSAAPPEANGSLPGSNPGPEDKLTTLVLTREATQ